MTLKNLLFQNYAGQAYYQNADEVIGQIRKNLPDAVSLPFDLVNRKFKESELVGRIDIAT